MDLMSVREITVIAKDLTGFYVGRVERKGSRSMSVFGGGRFAGSADLALDMFVFSGLHHYRLRTRRLSGIVLWPVWMELIAVVDTSHG